MEIRKRVGAKTKAEEEIKTRVAMEGAHLWHRAWGDSA